jgi:hypothetical protein
MMDEYEFGRIRLMAFFKHTLEKAQFVIEKLEVLKYCTEYCGNKERLENNNDRKSELRLKTAQ